MGLHFIAVRAESGKFDVALVASSLAILGRLCLVAIFALSAVSSKIPNFSNVAQDMALTARLKADGYTEIETKSLQPRPANEHHGHPFAVRGLVLSGASRGHIARARFFRSMPTRSMRRKSARKARRSSPG